MAGFPKINRTGEKARNPSNGIKIDKDLVIAALYKFRGNISRAADSIGMSRYSLHAKINADKDIKQASEDSRERFLDESEDVLRNKTLDGDTTCLLFTLKTIGRKRGYELDRDPVIEATTRNVLDFMLNQSKNPAES